MRFHQTSITRHLRTLLILGRASNLPTVWSNGLAGWLLGGGGQLRRLVWLCAGSTFLYLGGMYLNDAFDAQFDQQHRPERPIPSGAIPAAVVWRWGLSWLFLGLITLSLLGTTTAVLAAFLAISILIYDAIHKIFSFSPVLMAGCRFFLILVAASTAVNGVTGLSIWSALALAAYIVGLSYLARKESTKAALRYWPCFLLAAPVILALVVNQGVFQRRGFLMSAMFVTWAFSSLRHAYWAPQPNVGRSVSNLLAGIVLADVLAVGGGSPVLGLIFIALFILALLSQRFIPAT
jgi:hypothetical protein